MCSRAIAKILLFVFNLLFFTCGVLLLSFGIAGIADPNGLAGFIASIPGVRNMLLVINIPVVILNSAIFMIVLGSILILFGFLGCAGAGCLLKPLLFFYWLLLLLVLLAEIALIIYAAVSPSKAEAQVQNLMYVSLEKNFNPVTIGGENRSVTLPTNLVSVAWVSMQFQVPCCGVYNYSDYSQQLFQWDNRYTVYNGNQLQTIIAKVPPSCCAVTSKSDSLPSNTTLFVNLPECLQGFSAYNTQGCYKAVSQLVTQYSYIPIGICIAVIIFEAVCITCAIYLWRTNDAAKKEIA